MYHSTYLHSCTCGRPSPSAVGRRSPTSTQQPTMNQPLIKPADPALLHDETPIIISPPRLLYLRYSVSSPASFWPTKRHPNVYVDPFTPIPSTIEKLPSAVKTVDLKHLNVTAVNESAHRQTINHRIGLWPITSLPEPSTSLPKSTVRYCSIDYGEANSK